MDSLERFAATLTLEGLTYEHRDAAWPIDRHAIQRPERKRFLGLIPYTGLTDIGTIIPYGDRFEIILRKPDERARIESAAQAAGIADIRILPPYDEILKDALEPEHLGHDYVEGGDYGALLIDHLITTLDGKSGVGRFAVEPRIAKQQHGWTSLHYGATRIQVLDATYEAAIRRSAARLSVSLGEQVTVANV